MHNQIEMDSNIGTILLSCSSNFGGRESPIQISDKQYVHTDNYIGVVDDNKILNSGVFFEELPDHKFNKKIELDLFSNQDNLKIINDKLLNHFNNFNVCIQTHTLNPNFCYETFLIKSTNNVNLIIDF